MENSEERKGEASAEKIGMSTKDGGENISKKEKGWELERLLERRWGER